MTRACPPTRTFFGYPIGLTNLFGVELWERFSFYGMLTILGYYLYYSITDGGLGLSQSTATGVVGAYGGLVYLSTVLGGWVSDRLLGMERTVCYGGVVVMIGHLALALIPGLPGVGLGLVLIALGSGGVKANASSLLGTLYPPGDPRTAGGFTLFYLGINLGAFLGPLLTGLLQSRAGFHYGFAAAAVGMACGLVQYVVQRANLAGHGRTVPNPLAHRSIPRILAAAGALTLLIVLAVATGAVHLDTLSPVTTGVLTLVSAACFAILLTSPEVSPLERTRVRAFVPLFLANALFWSLFQQIFTVLTVYSDQRMNWTLFGWTAPASWIGSAEPIWVIALSPIFAALWTRLAERAPTTPHTFAYGVIGMGAAFLLFVPLTAFEGKTVPAWLVCLILAAFAISELLLSPIGLAVTTQLAPAAYRAQMMALYFLSVGIGTAMSGVLAHYYSRDHEIAYFGLTGIITIAVGIVVYFLAPRVSSLMKGVH
ncbi:peptide MFS transporter [Nocardia sp. alder85J]|uniref:peptide MFS transporter n=1 Tax=Nocardia sp. alder85J TaxID=2862949 RepID=UPI00224F7904|nr:oligopeptide:H+ symporter [Nocardia sp. alder85J]MCX4096177.1 oligopeptide:H+ symporter [Nocardia sp. alder85J]